MQNYHFICHKRRFCFIHCRNTIYFIEIMPILREGDYLKTRNSATRQIIS